MRRKVEQPLVSVIINCFNGEKYLSEAINSVLFQTYKNWELIFWDNQSSDRSAEIALSYDDPRIKYFYASKHTLLYEARNQAIEKSKAEFIAFLDADDWWESDKLAIQLAHFEDQNVGLVCTNYNVFYEGAGWARPRSEGDRDRLCRPRIRRGRGAPVPDSRRDRTAGRRERCPCRGGELTRGRSPHPGARASCGARCGGARRHPRRGRWCGAAAGL